MPKRKTDTDPIPQKKETKRGKRKQPTEESPKKPPKEPKRKPKYGGLSCSVWMLKKLWHTNKSIAVSAVAVIPLALILYAFGLYLTPTVLGLFEQGKSFGIIAAAILLLLSAQLLFRLVKDLVDAKRRVMDVVFNTSFQNEIFAHATDVDWYLWLEPEFKKKDERAWNAVRNGYRLPSSLANMVVNILCFVLFGSVVATLHPLIVLLLAGCSLITFFAQRYKNKRDWRGAPKRDLNQKKLNYIAYTIVRDMKFGKDIRLFRMPPFLHRRTDELIGEHRKNFAELQNTQLFVTTVSNVITMLRDGIAYGVLLYSAVNGDLSVAQFSLYFSAISQLSGFFSGILGEVNSLHSFTLQISDLREYFDTKGRLRRTGGVKPRTGVPLCIEFKNVSYTYPTGEKPVLQNVSFRIQAGEKIALVGLNGAGKTTLIRLMCGLLLPSEGEVLIDGRSVLDYNRDDLYAFFSILPQEYKLLPSSIAENITVRPEEQRDIRRMNECIAMAGLEEKIASLKDGVNTPLENRYNPDGVRLSGGETQKLLLARALYRQAPILILDEPTAALDPIAEDEMYRKYTETTKNCTSVFISHRLASTRFCDRIYLLDGATLAECGTHEQLMKQGGKYKELFDVQSQYYQ